MRSTDTWMGQVKLYIRVYIYMTHTLVWREKMRIRNRPNVNQLGNPGTRYSLY